MNTIQVITPILKKYHITKASLFGSYVRGDYDEKSDIDILIDPPENMGIEFISLKQELEDATKKKVDLVSEHAINKHLKGYIAQYNKSIL